MPSRPATPTRDPTPARDAAAAERLKTCDSSPTVSGVSGRIERFGVGPCDGRQPVEAQARPSSSGVRAAGDAFQWLAGWQACLLMRRDVIRPVDNPVVEVGIELDGVGNLDDVVMRRTRPPHTYMQIKYTVDSSSPVNEDYLLAPATSGGTSILAKIVDGWRAVQAMDDVGPGEVQLVLSTTRVPDPGDHLLSQRDTRTRLLVPRAGEGGSGSRRGRARARWARAADLSEAELLELLAVLQFDTGWDPVQLRELAGLRMRVVGLRDDAAAIDAGISWVGRQVQAGHRRIDRDILDAAITELGLDDAGPARSAVSIATLKPDHLAGDADVVIDWVERFDGEDAYRKRRPAAPATWSQLQAELDDIPRRLTAGAAVALTGSMRQATGFMVGAALRDVTGIAEVAIAQRGELWSSAHPYHEVVVPAVTEHVLGLGVDVAVVVAVAAGGPVVDDVMHYVRTERLPVDRLLVCQPPGGARDNAVPDAAFALGLALGIRDTVRRAASAPAARVHLFLIGPLGLAVLLGQRWNRVGPTVVYEDVHGPLVYEPAFTVAA